MTSRLFHTVVGVGLALGATTLGCAAEQEPDAATDTAGVSTYEAPVTPAPAVEADRYCEVAWPTTKGGPRPTDAQACIDPERACGTYPSESGFFWDSETCVRTAVAGDPNTCDFSLGGGQLWLFCKDVGTSHEWACPSGTIKARECVWPEDAKPAPEARR